MNPRPVRNAQPSSGRDTLSRDLVIDQAVAIADAEGLDAVTVRRVAQELGVTPMALYWHVSNKDELLAAMGDRLYDDLTLEVDPAMPWQDQLRLLTTQLLLSVQEHPRLAPLAGARVLANDNGRRITETALALLRSAGFSTAQSAAISRHVLLTTLAMVVERNELADQQALATRGALLLEKHAALAALSPDTYPNLVAAIDDLTSCNDEDSFYAYRIDLLLAGIEHLAPVPRPAPKKRSSRAR